MLLTTDIRGREWGSKISTRTALDGLVEPNHPGARIVFFGGGNGRFCQPYPYQTGPAKATQLNQAVSGGEELPSGAHSHPRRVALLGETVMGVRWARLSSPFQIGFLLWVRQGNQLNGGTSCEHESRP